MATRRITVMKAGGVAADVILRKMQAWSAARETADPSEWSHDQWPPPVRDQADGLAARLREHAQVPPVIHFIEWVDLWSMGDLFHRRLTPPGGPSPLVVYTNRFEVYGYGLPDGGRLEKHLAHAGAHQFPEYDQFVSRLREAVVAWASLVDRAALVVLREVVGGLVTDEEIEAARFRLPDWLSEDGR